MGPTTKRDFNSLTNGGEMSAWRFALKKLIEET